MAIQASKVHLLDQIKTVCNGCDSLIGAERGSWTCPNMSNSDYHDQGYDCCWQCVMGPGDKNLNGASRLEKREHTEVEKDDNAAGASCGVEPNKRSRFPDASF